MFFRPSTIVAFALGAFVSSAYADSGSFMSQARYAVPVCPDGANETNCLDNAYRAIDDLERRVSALEFGHHAPVEAASIRRENKSGSGDSSTNNIVSGVFHHPDCLPGSAWDGTACTRREN